jgi:cytochrome c553
MRLFPVTAAVLSLAFATGAVWLATTALAASPEKGKAAYVQHGCWQCHDNAGQGSLPTSGGKIIARTQLPLDAFKSFVRTTNGAMPPYRQVILADEELDDIYAYLQSLPPPKAVGDIPLLNGMRSE